METKSRSFPLSAEGDFVRLTDKPLDLQVLIDKVRGSQYGAVTTFCGYVRDTEEGRPIQSILYQAYSEMAIQEMNQIVWEAQARWPVRIALEHRTGKVEVGEPSVIIASAGEHRQEAFDACQYVINELKSRVPIWKVRYE